MSKHTQLGQRATSDRLVVAHRERLADEPRIRIGIGEHLAVSLSRPEAMSLFVQLNELFDGGRDLTPRGQGVR